MAEKNFYVDVRMHDGADTALISLRDTNDVFAINPTVSRLAIGSGTLTTGGVDTVAIGSNASAGNTGAVSLGRQAGAATGTQGAYAINIGYQTNLGTLDIGQDSITMGRLAYARTTGSISIGLQAGLTTGTVSNQSITIGYQANQGAANIGFQSVAIGYQADATSSDTIALGRQAVASGNDAIAIGPGTTTTAAQSIAIGNGAQGVGVSLGIAIGNNAANSAGSTRAVAIGPDATSGSQSVAIGNNAGAPQGNAVSVGNATATVTGGTAVGFSAGAGGGAGATNAISIGRDANGPAYTNVGSASIALGYGANSLTNNSIAVGTDSSASGRESIALGKQAATTVDNAGIINVSGVAATNGVTDTFVVHTADATPDVGVRAGVFEIREYTVATLPSVANSRAGLAGVIVVTDEVGGRTLASSDGTNWRRVSDGSICA